MEALARSGIAEVGIVADASSEVAREAAGAVGCDHACASLDEVLEANIDGVVIATPSALHAEQAIAALERGVAVFCQKPLARTEAETAAVIAAAERANRLLGVDLSYRFVRAVEAVRRTVRSGSIGDVFAVDLTFHNAYGPDKPWFTNPELSGGGCLIDLGTHLIDLALHALEWPEVRHVGSRLFASGRELSSVDDVVEDYATAELQLDGRSMRLACSWFLAAGADAVIEVTFYGTDGSASVRNVDGSFYDFRAELARGTTTQVLVEPPDDWGGRAAVAWARRLAAGEGFDPEVRGSLIVARTIDRIYGRSS